MADWAASTEPAPNELDQDTSEVAEASVNITVITPLGHSIHILVTLADSVQDIRQFLIDEVTTCYVTSYHLEYNNQPVNDFAEFAELDVKEGAQFYMIEDEYNETTARGHTRRLREIISAIPVALRKESASLFSHFVKDSPKQLGLKSSGSEEHAVLSEFFPEPTGRIKCIKKLAFSGWNPVPHYRRLQGDLFYLEVQTLEGNNVTVTACTRGFFINSSKQGSFNPNPADKGQPVHSLVELLQGLSSQFKENFEEILKASFLNFPLDSLPVPYPVVGWLGRVEPHVYDPNRAEEALIATAEVDFNIQGQLRDWNEELQQSRTMPRVSIHEKIMRDRALFRAHCDYVDAASRGAAAIVDGCVPPINPMDEPKAHMFIFNNIFFSYAADSRDFYKDLGGDETAYKQASNDLLGVSAYNRIEVPGLHTSGTAVIDYRGHRIIAQTIIPGLFSSLAQEDGHVNIGYGSLEGSEFKTDSKFHELMTLAAEQLLVKPHVVLDKEGRAATLAAHADIKGIIGSDQRHYILDVVRTTPRDSNYPDPKNIGAILRPELLDLYSAELRQAAQKEKLDLLKSQEEERKKTKEGDEKNKPTPEYLEELKKLASENVPIPPYNPDVFTPVKLGDSAEVQAEDEALVKKLGTFLREVAIQSLVDDLATYKVSIVDGATITAVLHSRGINLRYLGTIAQQLQQAKTSAESKCALELVLLREMITRAAKRIMNEYIRQAKDSQLANSVAHLLNAFFGKLTQTGKGSKSGLLIQHEPHVKPSTAHSNHNTNGQHTPQRLAQRSDTSDTQISVTHNELWHKIRDKVKEKYDYQLPELIPSAIFSIPTCRSICQKVGIQLAARNYDLSKEQPFKGADVLRLFPVTKHAEPRSEDSYELLEAGKSYMIQGRLDVAFDLLSEALTLLQQIYGPMQKEISVCHTNLARLHLATGDVKQSVLHQQKALVINERVLGLDHYETAMSYLTLGLYVHQTDKSKAALNYIKRANFLNHIIGGVENLENVSTYTQLAAALQDLDDKEESRYCLSKALTLSEMLFGQNHLQTARLNHQMAIAQSLAGNFKEAINFETRNYEICKASLGENHLHTMEANIWLTQLTRNAVQDAKAQHTTRKQQQRLMDQIRSSRHDDAKGEPGSSVQNDMANLSIMDLLKYIQEPSSQPRSLNKFYSSSRIGRVGPPKRTFPGGASAVARNPKAAPAAGVAASRTGNVTNGDASSKKKKRKRRKNKNQAESTNPEQSS